MGRKKIFSSKRSWWLLGIIGAVMAVLAFPLSRWFAAPPADPDVLRARQSAAMRPAFQGDLNLFAAAPVYAITATANPDNGNIQGRVEVHYTNQTPAPLPHLVVRLYPNARTIYGGGSMAVTAAAQAGQTLTPTVTDDPTILHLPLLAPLQSGQTTSLVLTYTAQVPYRSRYGYGIYNRDGRVMTLAGWYPIIAYHGGNAWQAPPVPRVGDAMLAQPALYEVHLTVPTGYTVAATGTTLTQTANAEGSHTTWAMVSGPAREFAAAVSDSFDTHEITVDGVTLRLHLLPLRAPNTSAATTEAIARDAFAAFNARYTPYPYTELDFVEAAVNIGGYEFPGMVFLETSSRAYSSRGLYQYLVAHEIAHQWWYQLVGSHTVTEPWLDESFATYSYIVFRNYAAETYGSGTPVLNNWRRHYARRSYDPPLDSSALDFGGWGSYRRVVYYQGALFLDDLRQEVGDEVFFSLLRGYLNTHRHQVTPTQTFLDYVQRNTSQDLTEFFAPWFE